MPLPSEPGAAIFAASADEVAAILALNPTFARFERSLLLAVAAQCGFATYEAGATVMRQGDAGNFACVILEGEADILVELAGRQVHVETVGRNRMIGELSVFTGLPRTATVVARSFLVVVRIEQASMMQLSAEHPPIGLAIIRDLAAQVASQNQSFARLKQAAEALGRGEFEPALLDDLTSQPGEVGPAAQAFADMAAAIRSQQHRREEMKAAADIQQSILPPPLPPDGAAARVDLHAEMHPAREVGGDFYDYFMLDPNRLALTVGDVSGKGIPGSLFMAVSRTVLRSVTSASDMAAGMAEANRLLSTQNTTCMFVTVFHGVLDLASGVLRYCNAGHCPPYLLRAAGGRQTLERTGLPMGINAELPYTTGEIVLTAGDALFVFSDGITEAFDPAGEPFGAARLEIALERCRRGGAAPLVGSVLAATRAFAGNAEQSDDITCLALVLRD
jgi:serine phosphatase RsbU (regulator of sigma subunit)